MEKNIKLTENNLKKIIKESVLKILKEYNQENSNQDFLYDNLDNYFNDEIQNSKEYQKDSDFTDMESENPVNIGPNGKTGFKGQGKKDSLEYLSKRNKSKEWSKKDVFDANRKKSNWIRNGKDGEKTDLFFK